MTIGREIMGKKACRRKATTGKKHSMPTCKKEMTAGRKQRTHAEKEYLMIVELGFLVRVFV
jgi:hypothetical protein